MKLNYNKSYDSHGTNEINHDEIKNDTKFLSEQFHELANGNFDPKVKRLLTKIGDCFNQLSENHEVK